MGKYFKTIINRLVIKRPQITTIEKKILIPSLPNLEDISLRTRTKLRKSFKGTLNCCKPPINFKSQRKLRNIFQFKDRLPFDVVSGVKHKYKCGKCNYSYYRKKDRHLKLKPGEHIGISPLTFRKVKQSKESAILDHLLFYNNTPSFDDFTILAYGHHKYIFEIRETLLISLINVLNNKITF